MDSWTVGKKAKFYLERSGGYKKSIRVVNWLLNMGQYELFCNGKNVKHILKNETSEYRYDSESVLQL